MNGRNGVKKLACPTTKQRQAFTLASLLERASLVAPAWSGFRSPGETWPPCTACAPVFGRQHPTVGCGWIHKGIKPSESIFRALLSCICQCSNTFPREVVLCSSNLYPGLVVSWTQTSGEVVFCQKMMGAPLWVGKAFTKRASVQGKKAGMTIEMHHAEARRAKSRCTLESR